MNGGPSDKAVEAVLGQTAWYADNGELRSDYAESIAERCLDAVHDPALGLDRSVCLRDVVEWVRDHTANGAWPDATDIEREFSACPVCDGRGTVFYGPAGAPDSGDGPCGECSA